VFILVSISGVRKDPASAHFKFRLSAGKVGDFELSSLASKGCNVNAQLQKIQYIREYDIWTRQVAEIVYRLARPGKELESVSRTGAVHTINPPLLFASYNASCRPPPSVCRFTLLLIAPLTQSLFPSLHLGLAPNSRRASRLRLVVWLLRWMVVSGLVFIWRRTGLLVGVLGV
jgi:hypothetical protein